MDLGHIIGLLWWISGKETTCNAGDRLKSLNNLIIPNTFLLRGNLFNLSISAKDKIIKITLIKQQKFQKSITVLLTDTKK